MFYVAYHNTNLFLLQPTPATAEMSPAASPRRACTDLDALCPYWSSQGTATLSSFCSDPRSVRCPLSRGRCTARTTPSSPGNTPSSSSSSSRSSPAGTHVSSPALPSTSTTIVATQPYTPPARCNGVDFKLALYFREKTFKVRFKVRIANRLLVARK